MKEITLSLPEFESRLLKEFLDNNHTVALSFAGIVTAENNFTTQ